MNIYKEQPFLEAKHAKFPTLAMPDHLQEDKDHVVEIYVVATNSDIFRWLHKNTTTAEVEVSTPDQQKLTPQSDLWGAHRGDWAWKLLIVKNVYLGCPI